jgi:hypothetical protein
MSGDNFVSGDDKMKVHRQLFVASQLLEKRIALPKAAVIAKAAASGVDAGLDIAEPATAVMAGELYESRAIAAARGQYVSVPQVQRSILQAVLRGRIEDIIGWAYYQMDDAVQAAIHLKRAVGVLPVDSAWWRSSTWRLGTALVVSGKDAEALDAYIKSYKSSGPDRVRYQAIEAVYKRVNGNTLGLEEKIGPDPSPLTPAETVAQDAEPAPEIKSEFTSTPESTPVAEGNVLEATPTMDVSTPKTEATVFATPEETKPTSSPETQPKSDSEATVETVETTEEKRKENIGNEKGTVDSKELFPSVVISIPTSDTTKITGKRSESKAQSKQAPTPAVVKADGEPKPPSSPTSGEIKSEEETKTTSAPTPAAITEDPGSNKVPGPENQSDPREFADDNRQNSVTTEAKPCTLIASEESITLRQGGGLAVIVRREDDNELEGLTAVSDGPENVIVSREMIVGVKTQALFILRSISSKAGAYQIRFELPCGKKEIVVKVQ